MAGIWDVFVGNLAQLGFFQFLLPFLLVLAIVYGVLRYAAKDILDKSSASLISIVIAFFFMNYSGGVGLAISDFFTTIFGLGSIVLTGILMVLILLGLIGIKFSDLTGGEKGKWVFAAFIIFLGFLIFVAAGGASFMNIPLWGEAGRDIITIIFFLIVLALAMWWMGRGDEGGGKSE